MKNNKDIHNREEIISILSEREKELNCLYNVEEILHDFNKELGTVFYELLDVIPSGWQFVDLCEARIIYNGIEFIHSNFKESKWFHKTYIIINNKVLGEIHIYYSANIVSTNQNIFLPEEVKLLKTIAERLRQFIFHKEMTKDIERRERAQEDIDENKKSEWKVIINLLKHTDLDLYAKISRKMLNHLSYSGVKKAKILLENYGNGQFSNGKTINSEHNENIPIQRQNNISLISTFDKTFDIASDYFGAKYIFNILQKWIKEDKISFLVKTLENINTSISEIIDSIAKYIHADQEKIEFNDIAKMNTSVMIIQRFFSDQLNFINVAKHFVDIEDFYNILKHSIYPLNSRGKLGGKSAGIYLADCIIKKMQDLDPDFKNKIKTPKTWYITSDTLMHFLNYNNLEEVIEQKYKKIEEIREEYPNIIQVFKNSYFPPEIKKGLSTALDHFGEKPIIVRSSSLLEDRFGAAFSGKYKSLFLANQGSKEQRLNALTDAIAEVYASTFGPDPIEYRKERELIDFYEEMAIMIQEVVGSKVGKYFFPAFAGVGFTNNDFKWSPRINRNDGLLRIVPGLGTRAVDRVSDDFPVLIAPGKPNIRVNVTIEEIFRYSPQKIDVINLEKNIFETIDIKNLLIENGNDYPIIEKLISINQDNRMISKSLFNLDFHKDDFVFTFNDLIMKPPFINNMNILLENLQREIKTPVDIEFAHDGKNLYLLQCRPQGFSGETSPSSIPQDIPKNDMVFTAKKYISNGKIPDISHIVYVDPQKYSELSSLEELQSIGKVVGKLNSILPKRKFILMGPGRWGSRGDIKLGVNVTYSDINNTAVLIEVAKEKGSYVPDLSFGTHFFQDLVEASIRYIPLYPDDNGIIFNEYFFNRSENIISELLPEFSHLENVISVIDVQKITNGRILRILMNADLDEAVAYLASPSSKNKNYESSEKFIEFHTENHWMWRLKMAQHIAKHIDSEYLGIKAMYVFGSAKNANAGPASDIDLLIHFDGNIDQKKQSDAWFDGWSKCLSEINFLKTGYKTDGLLDVHYITDKDIADKSSFAIKIGAITDAAQKLQLANQS
ncbi:MAG: nucleotidyltransferase domain-containing protein [Candidatus Cloacimonetes bacterium]|nr:nucleotidyltransferase domain-containing protein [Candidatus Cloacimonadota bacterium]